MQQSSPEILTHSSGATILLENRPGMSSLAMNLTFRTGSRMEPDDQGGITHFVEHLLFKGTKNRDLNDIARISNEHGGFLNATTSTDYMRVETRVIPDDAQDALELIRDMVLNSTFPDKEVERERGVILEEISEYRDSPEDQCFDEWLQKLWLPDPLGRPVLGTEESVEAITRDQLYGWLHQIRQPENMILSLAGPLLESSIREAAMKFFDDWNAGDQPLPKATKASAQSGRLVISRPLEQVQFCFGFEALKRSDPRRTAMHMCDVILGGGMGSRLFTEIREKRGLAYTIASSSYSMKHDGYFLIYGSTTPDAAEEVHTICCEELAKLAADGPTSEELLTAQRQVMRLILLYQDSPMAFANRNSDREVYGDHHISDVDLLERVKSVTVDDVKEIANELFSRKMAECMVGPLPEAVMGKAV